MDVQLSGTGISVNVTVFSGATSIRVIVRDFNQRRYTEKSELYYVRIHIIGMSNMSALCS